MALTQNNSGHNITRLERKIIAHLHGNVTAIGYIKENLRV